VLNFSIYNGQRKAITPFYQIFTIRIFKNGVVGKIEKSLPKDIIKNHKS